MFNRFNEYKSQHHNKTFMYGSKQDHKVGFALATAYLNYSSRLPDNLSIFTAEATALLAAVQVCVRQKRNNVIICSDSKLVLQAFSNTYSQTHNIISRIQECIPETQQISFLWIPGHAGIPGNEKADNLAKEALNKPERLNVKYPVDDCKAILQQHIQQLRQKTWNELGPQHSHNIKPHLAHCSSSKQNCRQKEVLLTRLRTGRTRLNARWLGTQQLNICPYCNSNTVPTVNHLLLADLCSTQLFLDSNQIGNFESWVESVYDSTIFSEVWFESTHDSTAFAESWFESAYDSFVFLKSWIESILESKAFSESWFDSACDSKAFMEILFK